MVLQWDELTQITVFFGLYYRASFHDPLRIINQLTIIAIMPLSKLTEMLGNPFISSNA